MHTIYAIQLHAILHALHIAWILAMQYAIEKICNHAIMSNIFRIENYYVHIAYQNQNYQSLNLRQYCVW